MRTGNWKQVLLREWLLKVMVTKKIIVFWRDIPSQVIITRGRTRGKVQLSHRFQDAIDRAAMRAGKGSSESYIEEWRRTSSSMDDKGNLQELASCAARQIEINYSDEQLVRLIKNHGVVGE